MLDDCKQLFLQHNSIPYGNRGVALKRAPGWRQVGCATKQLHRSPPGPVLRPPAFCLGGCRPLCLSRGRSRPFCPPEIRSRAHGRATIRATQPWKAGSGSRTAVHRGVGQVPIGAVSSGGIEWRARLCRHTYRARGLRGISDTVTNQLRLLLPQESHGCSSDRYARTEVPHGGLSSCRHGPGRAIRRPTSRTSIGPTMVPNPHAGSCVSAPPMHENVGIFTANGGKHDRTL